MSVKMAGMEEIGKPSKRSNWKTEIKKIKQCYQRQDASMDQLRDLRFVANRLGFYDAADYLKKVTGNDD